MKKFIYVVAALSLAACTSEEIMEVDVPSAKVQKGITFELGMPESDVLTRGGLTQQRNFFWFAETDHVNIYAAGAINGTENTTKLGIFKSNAGGDGLEFEASNALGNPAVYKATKSEANAYLTAVSDQNMLVFDGGKPACFIGLYPEDATLTSINDVAVTRKGGEEDQNDIKSINSINSIKFTTGVINQTVKMNEVMAPMWGISNGVKRNHDWESVGEKAQLQFERPFPVLKMSLKGTDEANEKYLKALGKLISIQVSNTTQATTAEGYVLSQPNLAATSATYDTKDGGKMEITNGEATSVTATIAGGGADWKVEDAVNISILPVLAKEYKGDDVRNKNLKFEISWTFAKKTITKVIEQTSPNDLATAHAVYDIRPLDLAKDAPYILTNDKKLYIFDSYQGKLRDLITDSKIDNTAISEITSIYSEVAFDDEDQDKLASFSKLETLELVSQGQTSLSKHITPDEGVKLTTVNLPYVSKVSADVFKDANLETVKMPAFDFALNQTLTATILKAGYLTTLDMSGVSSMKNVYPKDGMSLKDFKKLQTVTNQPGLVLGAQAFDGCEKLASLSSYVELGGHSAFKGCEKLPSVKIKVGNVIPEYTFMNATLLEKVLDENGVAIKPTVIGVSAFASTATNIDLSQTTSIGESAFEGVTTLKGIHDADKGIDRIDIAAGTIGQSAFSGCTGLKYVCFKNLTTVSELMLSNCTLTELKFTQKFKFSKTNPNGSTLGTTGGCKLFVHADQEYTLGNKLTFGNATFTFLTIEKE